MSAFNSTVGGHKVVVIGAT